jgi:hypothetical protein
MKAQRVAFAWAYQTYGEVVRIGRYQAFRFIEECLELVQAMGLTREDVMRVVDYVFSRPVGDVRVEIGDARLCLDILSETQGLDSEQMYDDCLLRVMALDPEKTRAKDKMKIEKGLC